MRPDRWLAVRTAPLRGGGRGWVLSTVAAGWFVTLGLRFVVPALLPRIKEAFTVGNAAVGFAVTVMWVAYAGMQLPAGALADRLGERCLLVGSLVLAGLALLLFSVLPVFALFVAVAGLFGLGTGLYGPARGLVLSKTFRDNDGAAFGVTLAAGSVGAAALPFVAVLVADLRTWETALAVFAPLFFALAAAVYRAVPGETPTGTDVATDRTADTDCPEPEPDGGVRVRPVVSAASTRAVVVAAVGAGVMLFTFQGLTAFYTTYLVEVKSLGDAVASGLYALLFLAGAGFQLLAGRAADRVGHRRVLVAVVLLGTPPLAALPLVDGPLAIGALTALVGVRLSMGPVVNAYVVSVIPDAVQGTTWGLVRTLFFSVGATGSVAVGYVADAGFFDAAMYGLAALSVPAAVVFLVLPDRDGAAASARGQAK